MGLGRCEKKCRGIARLFTHGRKGPSKARKAVLPSALDFCIRCHTPNQAAIPVLLGCKALWPPLTAMEASPGVYLDLCLICLRLRLRRLVLFFFHCGANANIGTLMSDRPGAAQKAD